MSSVVALSSCQDPFRGFIRYWKTILDPSLQSASKHALNVLALVMSCRVGGTAGGARDGMCELGVLEDGPSRSN